MTSWHYAAAVVFLFTATLGAGLLIARKDAKFPDSIHGGSRRRVVLEWKMHHGEAEAICPAWRGHPPTTSVARRGVLLDPLFFIPLSQPFAAPLCFGAAHVGTADGSARAVF